MTSRFGRFAFAANFAASLLVGCGGAHPPISAAPTSQQKLWSRSPIIYWHRKRVHVYSGAKRAATAVLTYKSRNGWHTKPVKCKHDSKVTAQLVKFSSYTAKYAFRTENPGPDACTFTAEAYGSGNPTATLKIILRSPL